MKIKYKYIYNTIFIGLVLHFFLINASYADILTDWKDSRAYKPRPILFLHGFGPGGPVGWNTTISTLSRWFSKYQPIGSYLETLDFQDPNGSVDTYSDGRAGWADKVKNKVDELLIGSKYGFYTNKLNLVCHSMGGLAAREYLTNPKYATSYVDELILIGVPSLGSRWADLANGISKSQKSGWLIIMPHAFVVVPARNSLDYGLEAYLSIDIDGEAVKDMMEDNSFLNVLNSRPQPSDVGHYGIYGILGTFLNWFISGDYFGGDGVVRKASQLGVNKISFKEVPLQISAFHTAEPAISVAGDNPLLKFLDSNKPEFEITYPGSGTTKIYESSIHIQGEVYKEYLPADTELIITITRQEDGYMLPPQSSLLKASDLWIPNNPDSPVAEFDELINFPGSGTYKISCQIKNPAGVTSDIEETWVIVLPELPEYVWWLEDFGITGSGSIGDSWHQEIAGENFKSESKTLTATITSRHQWTLTHDVHYVFTSTGGIASGTANNSFELHSGIIEDNIGVLTGSCHMDVEVDCEPTRSALIQEQYDADRPYVGHDWIKHTFDISDGIGKIAPGCVMDITMDYFTKAILKFSDGSVLVAYGGQIYLSEKENLYIISLEIDMRKGPHFYYCSDQTVGYNGLPGHGESTGDWDYRKLYRVNIEPFYTPEN